MAIEFTNKPIKWTNEGTAPSEDLKTNGFQAGYKPPAAVFNNQWHTTGECIEELQTKVSGVDDKKVDKADGKSLSTNDYTDDDKTKVGKAAILGEQQGSMIALHDENYESVDVSSGASGGSRAVFGNDTIWLRYIPVGGGDEGKFLVSIKGGYTETNYEPEYYEVETIRNGTTHKLTEKANASDLPIKSLEGQTVATFKQSNKPITTATAGSDAIIIGDTRERTFGNSINTELNSYSIASGNIATGEYSTATGLNNTATGKYALVGGISSWADGDYTLAFGNNAISKGINGAIALGYHAKSTGGYSSVAIGYFAKATAAGSVAIGNGAIASGGNGSVAIGSSTNATGLGSVAMGYYNTALDYQFKIGHYTKAGGLGSSNGTGGDAFIIGNGSGTSDAARSNAFRVTYAGKAYGLSAYGSSGADYAEYFEWKDGNPDNEDRRGRLVTLDGEKIRFATSEDDYILGIVSANPCVEGDIQPDDWQGKYLTDVFGQRLTQTVHIPARYEEREVVDPETGEMTTENILIEEEHDAVQWVLNPDFDPEQEYVSREDRKEWSAIGLMGKLVVIDDGTCEVNGYCKAGVNGIATKSRDIEGLPTNDGYRVMARIDDTHIRVLVK